MPIGDMSPDDIRGAYILYIGAGAVAAGGIISLLRSLPTIWSSLLEGLKDIRGGARGRASLVRTDQDLSMKVVVVGSIALVIAIMLARPLHMNLVGASLIVVLGFLFVTVSSRLTGEIGSSSNPISGMTVATLLLTCLVFLMLGWTGPSYYVTALSVGAIVCIASSNGGTTSQDLKTGFLVGATPETSRSRSSSARCSRPCCSDRSCSSSTRPRPSTCRASARSRSRASPEARCATSRIFPRRCGSIRRR